MEIVEVDLEDKFLDACFGLMSWKTSIDIHIDKLLEVLGLGNCVVRARHQHDTSFICQVHSRVSTTSSSTT